MENRFTCIWKSMDAFIPRYPREFSKKMYKFEEGKEEIMRLENTEEEIHWYILFSHEIPSTCFDYIGPIWFNYKITQNIRCELNFGQQASKDLTSESKVTKSWKNY